MRELRQKEPNGTGDASPSVCVLRRRVFVYVASKWNAWGPLPPSPPPPADPAPKGAVTAAAKRTRLAGLAPGTRVGGGAGTQCAGQCPEPGRGAGPCTATSRVASFRVLHPGGAPAARAATTVSKPPVTALPLWARHPLPDLQVASQMLTQEAAPGSGAETRRPSRLRAELHSAGASRVDLGQGRDHSVPWFPRVEKAHGNSTPSWAVWGSLAREGPGAGRALAECRERAVG